MEGVKISGVTVVGSDAPSVYHVAPRTEASSHPTTTTTTTTGSTPPAVTTQVGVSPPPPAGVTPLTVQKKRGRPRKYGPDGSVTKALSPKPISSASSSPVIDFSSGKRGKIRLPSAGKHHHKLPKIEMGSLGDWVSCSVGANFTPHIINVNAGEDVTMKVISFSQQGPRAICILSANGVISSVTLRQPDSSGGTLTYEGRFEILSLAGSFMPSESGGIRNRSGGMSVSLASPDGRVVGGGVAGLLVAAGPVQIVVGSFLTGDQHEQKTTKKPKTNTITHAPPAAAAVPATAAAVPTSAATVPTSAAENNEPFSATAKPNLSSPSFRGDNWSSYNAHDSRNTPTDINVSLQG